MVKHQLAQTNLIHGQLFPMLVTKGQSDNHSLALIADLVEEI